MMAAQSPRGEGAAHRNLIQELRRSNPNIQVGNFRKALATELAIHGSGGAWSEYSAKERAEAVALSKEYVIAGLIPDAYSIRDTDKDIPTLTLYEVVVSSDITAEKFHKLTELWWQLDCIPWRLELIVVNQTGKPVVEVPDWMFERMHCEYERVKQFMPYDGTVNMTLVYQKFTKWGEETPEWLLPVAPEQREGAAA